MPWLGKLPEDVTVMVSDPILIAWETPNCQICSAIPPEIVLGLASKYDDSQTICSKCGLKQRMAVIRDQFTVSELIEKFNGRKFPGKFIYFEKDGSQIIVELQDGEIE